MRIGIDISQIIYGTGVSVYTRNLVRELIALDQKNEYVLFGGSLRRMSEIKAFTSSLSRTVESRVLPFSPTIANLVWNKLHSLPIEYFIGKVDVLHTSDWAEPPSRAFKITTVHDLTPVLYPEFTHPRIAAAHASKLSWVKKESKLIIAPTQSTKDDLIKLGFEANQIKVIYEALDPDFKKATSSEVDMVLKKFNINGDFILMVGTAPRKNIARAIEAFDMQKCYEKLVIVGQSQSQSTKNITYTGFVNNKELVALYTAASVFLYPSLYEGFGLPILESFTAQTPVVTSNSGAMKETAGNAAVLVDPFDPASIAEGIEIAKKAKGIVSKGLKRVEDFSWQKAARETLKLYEEAK